MRITVFKGGEQIEVHEQVGCDILSGVPNISVEGNSAISVQITEPFFRVQKGSFEIILQVVDLKENK